MSDESDEVANDGMPLMIELRLEFHRALEEIEGRVIRMFALVAEDLAVVTDAILSGDDSMIGVLSEREQAIDLLNRETEALVNRHFACQSPVAGDLRLLRPMEETDVHGLAEYVALHCLHHVGAGLERGGHGGRRR